MDDFILVGKTKKTHGVRGGVKLQLEDRFLEDVLKVDVAFLKIQGKLLPYFVEGFDFTNKLIIFFEDIKTPEAAIPITSKEVYVRKKDLSSPAEVTFQTGKLQYGKLEGFEIYDTEFGTIGRIEAVMEFPQQEMAQVNYQGKEVLIPLNDQFILAFDAEQKQVTMTLPEGILSL